jgi:hypothetical protein
LFGVVAEMVLTDGNSFGRRFTRRPFSFPSLAVVVAARIRHEAAIPKPLAHKQARYIGLCSSFFAGDLLDNRQKVLRNADHPPVDIPGNRHNTSFVKKAVSAAHPLVRWRLSGVLALK